MAVEKKRFGHMPDGREITLYILENEHGLRASVTDLGAVWVGMEMPDRDGNMADVALGYGDADGYLENDPHFGSIVGRVANRTANARFVLHGQEYSLAANNGSNNLHSGPDYYDTRLWDARVSEEKTAVQFSLTSPDQDQGFPGTLQFSVEYELTEENTLLLTYRAVSDQDTPFSPTNHVYLNLLGHDGGTILTHEVRLAAEFYTPSSAESIPTGEVRSVSGTPMDFLEFKEIGKEIDADFPQLLQAGGYDHNWCLSHEPREYGLAAQVRCRETGRCLDVYTDCSGIQLYTANGLGSQRGKAGASYGRRTAFCLETQNWPNAVNNPHFPSPILKAGETFRSKTGYHFYIER